MIKFLQANAALSRRSILILFLVAFAATFAVRTIICQRDVASMREATGSNFTPFLVESSIMYSYVLAAAYDKGGIPEYDKNLAAMENVKLTEQMPIGLEPFLGYGLKVKNALPGLNKLTDPDFVRFQARLWVSLAGGMVLLWLLALRIPAGWSLFGALLYAVAPAAVARATGQDLLCEVMALPFLVAAFAFSAWYLRRPRKIHAVAFMISIFGAVAFWDISQFVFAVWALLELVRSFIDSRPRKRRFTLFLLCYVVLIMTSILVPYHRAHGMILSPMLLVLFPVVICLNIPFKRRRIYAAAALLGLGLVWLGISYNSSFSGNYSHFAELIKAKLKFMNVKPKNPALLNFEARVLWTPALHSADWRQVLYNFPGALWVTGVLFLAGLFFRKFRRQFHNPQYFLPPVMALLFFVIFIFLFRFHVLAVIFLSVACAMTFALWSRMLRRRWQRIVLILAAALTFYAETDTLFFRLVRSYQGFSLPEISELMRFLNDSKIRDRVVLSSMELSPMVKAYTDAAIVVQPKFEFPQTRDIFRTYVDSLFSPRQEDFIQFCNRYNVDFYVYYLGTGLGPMHMYSYRYMAAANVVPATSAAYLLDTNALRMKNFYEISTPRSYRFHQKFRVFRFIKPADVERSRITAELALEAWEEGRYELARKLARAAYLLNPNSEDAYLVYYKVFDRVPLPSIKDFLEIPK